MSLDKKELQLKYRREGVDNREQPHDNGLSWSAGNVGKGDARGKVP